MAGGEQRISRPRQRLSWLDEVAKSAAGPVARYASLPAGVARGAWHTAKDLYDAGAFVTRLLDPLDAQYSPRGEAAWDQVVKGVGNLVNGAKIVINNPRPAMNRVATGLNNLNARLDSNATPVANTMAGELRRQANLGLNQGEALFDIGSLLYGGAEVKALIGAGRAAKVSGAANLTTGARLGLADYFATPYTGSGHHYLPKRTELPALLGGGPVPRQISDSPFFLLKPGGISTGDMYELHYKVDPLYGGGKVPARFGGGGWSGKSLGWEKLGPAGRVWYGAPAPLKAAVGGGGVVGVGALVDQASGGEERR